DHPSLNRPVAAPVGPLWTDGSVIYLLRSQPTSPIALGIKADLTTIDLSTGQTAILVTGSFTSVSSDGSLLYLRGPNGVQRFDLNSGQLTPFVSLNYSGGIAIDNSMIYFTVSFPDGAIGTIDRTTGNMTVLAGALYRDVDGSGSSADFGIY